MSSRAVKDVQRALDAIRSELDGANWRTRLEALQVMLAASEQIVAMARKLDPPKRKPIKGTSPSIKQTPRRSVSARPTSPAPQKNTRGADRSLAPIKPVPPLANQRD